MARHRVRAFKQRAWLAKVVQSRPRVLRPCGVWRSMWLRQPSSDVLKSGSTRTAVAAPGSQPQRDVPARHPDGCSRPWQLLHVAGRFGHMPVPCAVKMLRGRLAPHDRHRARSDEKTPCHAAARAPTTVSSLLKLLLLLLLPAAASLLSLRRSACRSRSTRNHSPSLTMSTEPLRNSPLARRLRRPHMPSGQHGPCPFAHSTHGIWRCARHHRHCPCPQTPCCAIASARKHTVDGMVVLLMFHARSVQAVARACCSEKLSPMKNSVTPPKARRKSDTSSTAEARMVSL